MGPTMTKPLMRTPMRRGNKNSDEGDNSTEVGDTIITELNKKWTWKAVVDRKAWLVVDLKSLVELDTVDNEFRKYGGREAETDYHKERVEEAIRY